MTVAVSGRMPPVIVEYDCRGARKQKRFTCAYEARRFYASKLQANKNPKVKKEN